MQNCEKNVLFLLFSKKKTRSNVFSLTHIDVNVMKIEVLFVITKLNQGIQEKRFGEMNFIFISKQCFKEEISAKYIT